MGVGVALNICKSNTYKINEHKNSLFSSYFNSFESAHSNSMTLLNFISYLKQ